MAWETKWQAPATPEWAKPQLDKITEEAKEASKWVATITSQVKDSVKVLDVKVGNKSVPFEHYKTQPIKLGNKTIQVTVVGDLGLDFCEPGEKDEGWNIYHLPTLACFSKAVPPVTCPHCLGNCNPFIDGSGYCDKCKGTGNTYEFGKPELLNWMARVQENYPTSWQVLRLLTPDTYQDNGATAKEIIQKWCLSVKVE